MSPIENKKNPMATHSTCASCICDSGISIDMGGQVKEYKASDRDSKQ